MLVEMDKLAVMPMLIVGTGAVFLLLYGLLAKRVWQVGVGLFVCALAWVPSYMQFHQVVSTTAFNDLLFVDAFNFFLNSIILAGAGLTLLLNDDHLSAQRVKPSVDIDVLVLLAALGGMVMVAAANLMVLFIGFELLSVSVYALTGLARTEKASAEGALKYFILGAFSSAFLLYGIVLIYGATGSMELLQIAANASSASPMLLLGLGLIIFGFCFKVSLVPFHFWTPDAYQGAPVSIATFMAVVVKAAAFGSFLRVMYMSFGQMSEVWIGFLWTVSVITMTVGNIVALRQNSVKRMLAYSSIAHAGYALMGFLVMDVTGGGAATLFYLLVYALMTVGSFGVVLIVTAGTTAQYETDDIESYRGFAWSHPLIAFAMAIAMLSLAGMPPLAGFFGKFYLFSAAIQGGFWGLAIIAALNSVVSLYYYLRVLVVMYFSERDKSRTLPSLLLAPGPRFAVAIATAGSIYLGFFSRRWYEAAEIAMKSLG